jgi:ketosteroid isomerase-like protein
MTLAMTDAGTGGAAREVRAVLESLASALRMRDARAVTALYAEGAFVADLAPPLVHRGTDAAELQRWLDGWDGPVEMTLPDLEVVAEGDLALCQGLMRIETSRGGEAASWWSRATYGLRRGPEGWRIFHEHNSVPFYMDGSDRAAIDLQP